MKTHLPFFFLEDRTISLSFYISSSRYILRQEFMDWSGKHRTCLWDCHGVSGKAGKSRTVPSTEVNLPSTSKQIWWGLQEGGLGQQPTELPPRLCGPHQGMAFIGGL